MRGSKERWREESGTEVLFSADAYAKGVRGRRGEREGERRLEYAHAHSRKGRWGRQESVRASVVCKDKDRDAQWQTNRKPAMILHCLTQLSAQIT